jgi:arginyl-tRNA synthetase
METFQTLLAKKLADALTAAGLPNASELTPASDARFGDYQTNAALLLGKQRGENPRKVAEKILGQIDVGDLCDPPTVAGAGFINFTLRAEAVAEKAARLLQDERLGVTKTTSPRKIVIDFGSPNVAKPMHVGHIRSTVLGDALARIAQFFGHEVIRDNHIGDWGTQFGYIIVVWKNILGRGHEADLRRQLDADPFGTMLRLYVIGRIGIPNDPGNLAGTSALVDDNVHEKARQEVVKLQSGDPENAALWQEMIRLSQRHFDEIYKLLDIHYDIQRGESFYNDRLPGVVERLLKSGIAEISEGAVCVFFRDIPELADKPCIIRKRDGGYNYATTDVATIDYRINDLKADTIWIVTGAPQILHFKQIFEIARREGYKADFRHITHGSILGENRKLMKTRSGENVPLRDLLDEACGRARKIVEEKNPDLSDAEKIDIAQKIGIGAIKYADLSQYRMTDYVFSWDKMLSLQGNTAPYLQNAYVRIRSIFRKAGETQTKIDQLVLAEAAEINLAKRLCQFAEVVPQVLNDFRPNILANYLFELANSFHTFYEACQVLKSEEPTRGSRLALCNLSGRVLQRGLDLLGIKVPEKM